MTYIQPRHQVREGYRYPRSVCAVSFDAGPTELHLSLYLPTLFAALPTHLRRFYGRTVSSFEFLIRHN